jgi:hypothetical protein
MMSAVEAIDYLAVTYGFHTIAASRAVSLAEDKGMSAFSAGGKTITVIRHGKFQARAYEIVES